MSFGIGKNMSFDFRTAARVLGAYCQPSGLKVGEAEADLGYNSAKIFGFRSWLVAMGLLKVTQGKVVPTPLCHAVLEHDPDLEALATTRLMYYEISVNRTAEAWFAVVNYVLHDAFLNRRAITYEEVRDALSWLGVGPSPTSTKQRDKDAALSLRALVAPKAFGRLRLLAESEGPGRGVQLLTPSPDEWVLAYDLVRNEQSETPYHRLNDLGSPGRAARVFFWRTAEVEAALGSLESRGLLRTIRSAGLNQVVWHGPSSLIQIVERMYENAD